MERAKFWYVYELSLLPPLGNWKGSTVVNHTIYIYFIGSFFSPGSITSRQCKWGYEHRRCCCRGSRCHHQTTHWHLYRWGFIVFEFQHQLADQLVHQIFICPALEINKECNCVQSFHLGAKIFRGQDIKCLWKKKINNAFSNATFFGGVWHILSTVSSGYQDKTTTLDCEAFRLLFRQSHLKLFLYQ